VLLAQAIGRWGNWFNQELFGGPTTLPWGLEIDCQHRPAGYGCDTHPDTLFHPTFLYESLYCFAGFGLLLWAERRWRFRRGQMVAAYVAYYTFGRFWFELMRVDPAPHIFGVRVNVFVSILLFVAAVSVLLPVGRRGRPHDAPPSAEDQSTEDQSSERQSTPGGDQ
jgi:prolipoprotein diacylglyceryltransferase